MCGHKYYIGFEVQEGEEVMKDCPYGGICSVTCEYYTLWGCTRQVTDGDFLELNLEDTNNAED